MSYLLIFDAACMITARVEMQKLSAQERSNLNYVMLAAAVGIRNTHV